MLEKYITRPIENRAQWDEFVANTPQYSIFSIPLWLNALAEAMDCNFEIVACYKGNEIVGGVGLYVCKELEGKTARCPILTQYNGVHIKPAGSKHNFKNEIRTQAILDSIINYIERNYAYACLINHPQLLDIRPFQWQGWNATVRYTYYLPLDKSAEERLSPDIIRRSKLAQGKGLKVVLDHDVEAFYNLWKITCQRQKTPVPLDFYRFCRIADKLKAQNLLVMLSVRDRNNKMLATNILLKDKQAIFYWLAATDVQCLDSGANQLLAYEMIKSLSGKYSYLDLMGADISNISYYKSTMGGKLVAHYQLSKAISLRAKMVQSIRRIFRIFRTHNL